MKRAGGVFLLLASLVAPLALAVVATTATPAGASPPTTEYAVNPNPSSDPGGIVAGPDGKMWFTEPFVDKIGRINTDGTGYTEFPLPAGSLPRRIVVGPDGNLWFNESGSNKVAHIGTDGGGYTEVPEGASDLVSGPDGNVWTTDDSGIGRITPAGVFSHFFRPGGAERIVTNPDGALWFIDGSPGLHRITTAGVYSDVPFTGGQFGNPSALVSAPNGDLWVTTDSQPLVHATTAGAATVVPTPVSRLRNLTVGPDGAVWVINSGGGIGGPIDNAILRVDPSSGRMVVFPTKRGATVLSGIGSGPEGSIWYSQSDPDIVGKLSLAKKFASVAIASTANPGISGTFDITATVASADGTGTPTGQIAFLTDSNTSLGTANIVNGVATLHDPTLAGNTTVIADYAGDATFAGNTSAELDQHVSQVATTTTLSILPNGYSRAGNNATLTATVTQPNGSPALTGVVRFYRAGVGQIGGDTPIAGNTATLVTSSLPQGLDDLYAVYVGDAAHTGSTSSTVEQFVDFNAQLDRYVEEVYIDLLGRLPEAGGRAYWTGQLSSGVPRSATSLSLVSSNEYRSDVIASMYEQFLQRGTDAGGLAFWVSQVGRGMTFEQFQSMLMGSDEYFHMPSKGNGDNDTFVRAMFHDVLGRDVDPSGEAYYVSQLQHGVARSQVVAAIVYSTEHLQTTVDGYYQFLLGRDSEPGGLAFWVGQLQHGARDETIVALIIGSDEYYSLVA